MRSLIRRVTWHFPKSRYLLIHRLFAVLPKPKELLAWKSALAPLSGKALKDVSVVCITKRAWLGKRVLRNVRGFDKEILNGDGALSFSQLCNKAIIGSQTELIVITSDKCFPTTRTIREMQKLLSSGYGLVCAYRFGCFGLSKTALTKVGLLDEKFAGGGYEDADLLIRFWEANIAVIETEAIPYFPLPSLWKIASSSDRFDQKWQIIRGENPKRLIDELPPSAQLDSNEIELLPFNMSRLCDESIKTGIKFFG